MRRPRRLRPALLVAAALVPMGGCGDREASAPARPVACEDVPFTADSDDVAAEIRAAGVSCDRARAVVRESGGAPGREFRGYDCTSRKVEGEAVLVHSVWRCTRGDALITWKRF
jgi:hypothetical protein